MLDSNSGIMLSDEHGDGIGDALSRQRFSGGGMPQIDAAIAADSLPLLSAAGHSLRGASGARVRWMEGLGLGARAIAI